jgi:hypothetical protein
LKYVFLNKVASAGWLILLAAPAALLAQNSPAFFAHHSSGKCLDFGAPPQPSGSPVFLYDCNGSAAQQIQVQEINARHGVILHAGAQVIGVREIPPENTDGSTRSAITAVPADIPLELQSEARLTTLASRQIFALDGDSILLAADRSLVVKAPREHWTNRTQLVLGQRNVTDAEFWTFSTTHGTTPKLTSGFVRVPQEMDLSSALLQAKWGTVIEVDPNTSINVQQYDLALTVPAGVTIRGGRSGVHPGAEIYSPYPSVNTCILPNNEPCILKMLFVAGSDVRITGLRLRGPSPGRDHTLREAEAIVTDAAFNTLVDHNELSEWPGAAVVVLGESDSIVCTSIYSPSRVEKVRIVSNFFHNNERWPTGYGVVMGAGGYSRIERNTFSFNRHAISDDGSALSGYRAWYNLVLNGVPTYSGSESDTGLFGGRGPQQDFDMHGTDPASGSSYVGGVAGDYIESSWNTFLSGGDYNRHNFELRGTPCYYFELHSNVMLEGIGDSIQNDGSASKLIVTADNRFNAPNPTDHLGKGDFDGDGKEDLFLATGAAWYYAPGGSAEWRFLNNMTTLSGSLLFGDFDGDGRTDVFTQSGRDWLVSWGGTSPWEKINESDAQMTDFVIGDFDGDGRSDVFYADGQQWRLSGGGVELFEFLNYSSYRVPDLRFGDFNGDGKTDVFGIEANQWSVSYGGTSHWSPLPHTLTSSVAGLMVADFNGDGRADIATFVPVFSTPPFAVMAALKIAFAGASDWATVRTFTSPVPLAAIGRFSGAPGADIIMWNQNYLSILVGGAGTPQRWSLQDAR